MALNINLNDPLFWRTERSASIGLGKNHSIMINLSRNTRLKLADNNQPASPVGWYLS